MSAPIDMGNAPAPPAHEQLVTDTIPGTLLINPNAPTGLTWWANGVEFARMECCGCSYRFMPHGDVVIVPCKKHKKKMLAIGGHCAAK